MAELIDLLITFKQCYILEQKLIGRFVIILSISKLIFDKKKSEQGVKYFTKNDYQRYVRKGTYVSNFICVWSSFNYNLVRLNLVEKNELQLSGNEI